MSKRVLIAEIAQETNQFKRVPTDIVEVRDHCATLGDAIPARFGSTREEMGGFLEAGAEYGWTLFHPIAMKVPSGGPLTDDAFAFAIDHLERGLRRALPLDGVLLALHGAMCTLSHDDAEAEILRRVRAIVGPDVPLALTLDPHGNVTAAMVDKVDILTAFRTSPHTDHKETALRAAAVLRRAMAGEVRPKTYLAKRRMLIGFDGCRTYHDHGPFIDALAKAAEYETEPGVLLVSLSSGYARCDFPGVGPAVVVTGDGDDPRYQAIAESMMNECWARRNETSERVVGIEEAMAALAEPSADPRPIVLGDYGDAPGGGGNGDGTNLLKALLDAGIGRAALAAIHDPEAVERARETGVGRPVSLLLGGKRDPAMGGGPLAVNGTVVALSDGAYELKGRYATGRKASFGPSAAIAIDGVTVIVTTRCRSIYDLEQFRIFGIEPAEQAVVVCKTMQGHRADFAPIAREMYDVDSGGITSPDLKRYPWRKVERPIWPLDPIDTP
jgi:microcystin degradation protein MlrC